MDLLHNLALGFGVAFTVQNLLYAFFGCVLGTLIGVLPGHRPGGDDRDAAAVDLRARRDAGADHAGRHLLRRAVRRLDHRDPDQRAGRVVVGRDRDRRLPDGAPGPRRRRRSRPPALGSFFAGCVGTIIIAAFAPPLTELAFKFGPAEYFSLMVLGLIGAVVLASGSLLKAISMIILGLLLAQINTDVISGTARYSFDIPELTDGIGFVVIAMGVFGFGEIIANLGQPAEHREVFTSKVKGLWPTQAGLQGRLAGGAARHRRSARSSACCRAAARCSSSFASYTLEKKLDAQPGAVPFGKGAIQGVAGARIGQQRRRADLVHPDADARHSAERGDGADGRRDDDQGHPAGPAGDDQQPAAVLGPDRLDVGRQPDAGRS